MADFSKIISHIRGFEGEHSSDPSDNALRGGHSGVKGGAINPATKRAYDSRYPNNFIHTNRGIIWATYKEYARRKGKTATSTEFLAMPYTLWFDIYKTLFWDGIKGDKFLSQGIAENFLEAIWGGGSGRLVTAFKRYLNKTYNTKLLVNNQITDQFVETINKTIRTRKQYEDAINFLYQSRLGYLQSLADWKKYAKGWSTRLNELKNRGLKYKFPMFDWLAIFKIVTITGAFFF